MIRDETFTEYRNAPGLNKSSLYPFWKSSLHGAYELERQRTDTRSTTLGSALHKLVEQRGDWSGIITHTASKSTTTKAYAAEVADNPEAVVVVQDDAEKVGAMYSRMLEHPRASKVLRASWQPEASLYWNEPLLGGEACKARVDCLLPGVGAVDIKTVRECSTRAIESNIADFGYHAQVAFYTRAMMHAAEIERPSFLFVWIESAPPFDCVVSGIPDDDIRQGWAELEIAFANWKRWKETGRVQGISDDPLTLGLPRYRQNEGMVPVGDPFTK